MSLEIHDSPSQQFTCEDCHRAGRVTITLAGHCIPTSRLRPDKRAHFCRPCAKRIQETWNEAREYESTTGCGMSVT